MIVRLNGFSNCFLELSCFFFLLLLEFLELCSVFQHFLRVLVSGFLELNLELLSELSDLLFITLFLFSLMLGQLVILGAMTHSDLGMAFL